MSRSAKQGVGEPRPSVADTTPRHATRQPQISCNSCRAKKLKCDRGNPCSSCIVRGLSCQHPGARLSTTPHPATTDQTPSSSLELRLRALEDAVFGSTKRSSPSSLDDVVLSSRPTPPLEPTGRPEKKRRLSNDVALDYSLSSWCNYLNPAVPLEISVYPSVSRDEPRVVQHAKPGHTSSSAACHIIIPQRRYGYELVDIFLQTNVYMRAMFHKPSLLKCLDELYDSVSAERQVNLSVLALALSICAACSAWRHTRARAATLHPCQGYTKAPGDWISEAWTVLAYMDQTMQPSLEQIQARVVLGDLLYNLGGYTSSMRFITGSTIAMARELGLHLIDHPTRGSDDNPTIQEIKRRVWWQLTGSDWCMATMGGYFDRTYTISPRHMAVRLPLNIDDQSLDAMSHGVTPQPSLGPTPVSHLLLRAETSRIAVAISDALHIMEDVDCLSFEEISKIDDLFLAQINNTDYKEGPDTPAKDISIVQYSIQRDVLMLSIHSRRSRFLRPFLLTRPSDPSDRRYVVFRQRCLDSAQRALEIATAIVRKMPAVDSIHRKVEALVPEAQTMMANCGIVLSHFFQVCAITCADPALATTKDTFHPAVEQRRNTLREACCALNKVSEESPWAAKLLRRLVTIIKKYKVGGMDACVHDDQTVPPSIRPSRGAGDNPAGVPPQTVRNPRDSITGTSCSRKEWETVVSDPSDEDLGLADIWGDFMTMVPDNDEWLHMFDDLDNFGETST